jgi:hypothetical protein
MVASKTTHEGVWFKRFLEELGFSQERKEREMITTLTIKQALHSSKIRFITTKQNTLTSSITT